MVGQEQFRSFNYDPRLKHKGQKRNIDLKKYLAGDEQKIFAFGPSFAQAEMRSARDQFVTSAAECARGVLTWKIRLELKLVKPCWNWWWSSLGFDL